MQLMKMVTIQIWLKKINQLQTNPDFKLEADYLALCDICINKTMKKKFTNSQSPQEARVFEIWKPKHVENLIDLSQPLKQEVLYE